MDVAKLVRTFNIPNHEMSYCFQFGIKNLPAEARQCPLGENFVDTAESAWDSASVTVLKVLELIAHIQFGIFLNSIFFYFCNLEFAGAGDCFHLTHSSAALLLLTCTYVLYSALALLRLSLSLLLSLLSRIALCCCLPPSYTTILGKHKSMILSLIISSSTSTFKFNT